MCQKSDNHIKWHSQILFLILAGYYWILKILYLLQRLFTTGPKTFINLNAFSVIKYNIPGYDSFSPSLQQKGIF